MEFTDAKTPSDTIEAVIREETHGDLVEVVIYEGSSACVYLSKESAFKLGEHLIKLSKEL